MRDLLRQAPGVGFARALLGLVLLEGGHQPEAQEHLDLLVRGGSGTTDPLGTLGHAAALCAWLGDRETAAELYPRLEPYAECFAVAVECIPVGPVARFCGLLATTLGRWDEAEAHFERALDASERAASPSFGARTRVGWAEMLIARGDRGDAVRSRGHLEKAVGVAHELGMRSLSRRAEILLGNAAR